MAGDKWPSHGRSFLENEPHVSSSFSTGSLVPDSSPPPPAPALRLLTLFMCLHLHALCDGFAWLVFQVNDRGTWGKTNVQVQQIVEESHSTINLASPPHSKRVKDACKEAVMMPYPWSVKTGKLALTMMRLGFSEGFISRLLSPIPPNWLCRLSATPHSAVII